MKILVTGGRNYSNPGIVFAALDYLKPCKIVHGGARGADSLASRYANNRHVSYAVYPAIWRDNHGNYNRAAGIQRNMQMLDVEKPDIVLAFPGGKGTRHMITYAQNQGYTVITAEEILVDGQPTTSLIRYRPEQQVPGNFTAT